MSVICVLNIKTQNSKCDRILYVSHKTFSHYTYYNVRVTQMEPALINLISELDLVMAHK